MDKKMGMILQSQTSGIWLLFCLFGLCYESCGPRDIDPELFGLWVSSPHSVTIRAETLNKPYEFTKDTITSQMYIHSDYTVTGRIGDAWFENGKITANWLLPPGTTGIAYTIQFELSDPIFTNDPLPQKKVELWLAPITDNIEAELRYISGGAHFPMAKLIFNKMAKR